MWNGAKIAAGVAQLLTRCTGVVVDIAKTLDLGKIKNEFKPLFKEGLTEANLQKMFDTLNLNQKKIKRFRDCVGKKGEFAYKPQWNKPSTWLPWGRTYEEAVHSYDLEQLDRNIASDLKMPVNAISVSLGISAGKIIF